MKASNPKFLKAKAKINGLSIVDCCLFIFGVLLAKERGISGFKFFIIPFGLIGFRFLIEELIRRSQLKFLFLNNKQTSWEYKVKRGLYE